MHFALGSTAKEVSGPELTVDCLWCGQRSMAHSRQLTEWLTLFHILPLFPLSTVFVKCGSCHQDMVVKCSLTELALKDPVALKYLLVKKVSLVGKVCVILGLLLCWAFWIGLIPAIIGFLYGRRYGGWLRKWGLIGLVMNIFSPIIFLIAYVLIKLI